MLRVPVCTCISGSKRYKEGQNDKGMRPEAQSVWLYYTLRISRSGGEYLVSQPPISHKVRASGRVIMSEVQRSTALVRCAHRLRHCRNLLECDGAFICHTSVTDLVRAHKSFPDMLERVYSAARSALESEALHPTCRMQPYWTAAGQIGMSSECECLNWI